MTDIRRGVLASFLLNTTAAAALLVPAAALAQDAGKPVVLDPVTVGGTAETGTGPVGGYVAKRTTAGSKTDTPVEAVPQSVSVIGREEIDDRRAQKADEALRYTAGVYGQPFGPDGDTNWMFIRGFQATQTGVFQDGLQLYSYGFGGMYVDTFPLERIEVLRGASSVLYGGSNPGGLVKFVSKRPDGQRLRYVETGIDDAGTANLGFDFGDKAGETLSYRLTGRVAGGDGYSKHEDGFRGTISPSITWAPDSRTSVTLLANYTDIDKTHNGGAFLPYVGTVVDAPFGKISRDANFTEPGIDTYRRRQGSLGYEVSHTFDNDLTVRQNARYGYSKVHEVNLYPFGYAGFSPRPTDPTNQLARINFEHETTVSTFAVDNQLQGTLRTGPVEHTALVGVDYRYFRMDQMQATGAATTISATNPVYGAAQGARTPYIDQTLTLHQLGVYAQDQLRFGQGWLVTLNGRYDRATTKAVGLPSYEGSKGQLSGRAGLAYEFANGMTPYASTSTFFNPVLGSSAASGVFKPETGTQYEVGLKYRPAWVDGLFTVALFDLTRRNVVTGPFLAETQIGEVNSRGVEFEGKVNVTRNLKATAAVTLFDLEITKDADPNLVGKTPFIVPERQASLALDYTFKEGALDGVVLGGGVRHIGSSWVDNENTLKVPAATVFDARVGYRKDNWGVDLNVANLFDKAYVASCQTQFSCGYAEGRTLRLTAHMAW